MSTLAVTVERLVIHDHPNADALELAQVGLYRAVVAKGAYITGDFALYIPEQAVLPDDLIAELGLTGRLAGKNKNRVKAVKLRGELSQGIVCRPAALCLPAAGALRWNEPDKMRGLVGVDAGFAEDLGITKWVPPVPVGMAGKADPAPRLLPWTDIENIRRYPDLIPAGRAVVATEKVHGTCFLATWDVEEGEFMVSSKGVGARSLALRQDPGNLYWRAAEQYGLRDVAYDVAERLGASRVGLFGEVYGAGVQDLTYGADAGRDRIGFALFDVAYDVGFGARFMHASQMWEWHENGWLPVPMVPILYKGRYDFDILATLAEGRETLTGNEVNVREGVVVRPWLEDVHPTHGRMIGKIVGEGYLLRKGGTEFE